MNVSGAMRANRQINSAVVSTSHVEPAAASYARPIAFNNCLGMHHPASGRTGVVLCGPWGYDDLVIRAAWRELAERLAAAGFPCLRFEYPAMGNSLGDPEAVGFDDWVATARRACDLLCVTGVSKVVFLGHGFGAMVARAAAALQPQVAGVVLMAPTNARRFLRESAHLAAMIASAEGLEPAKQHGLTVAGFTLPPRVHADLKSFGPEPVLGSGTWTLLVEPEGRHDERLAAELASDGSDVERLPFTGFESLMGDPTTTIVPDIAFDAIVGSLSRRFPEAPLTIAAPALATICPPRLAEATFREEAVTFGADNPLFGILCTPTQPVRRAIVLFLSTGRNPHTGWRRMTVDHARALAQESVASLRFDIAGVGESPRHPKRPHGLLFTNHAVADVRAACDMAFSRGYDDVLVVGVCSGAYLGLLATVDDPRIRRLVAINLPRFAWGPSESIEAAVRFANRPAAHSVSRLMRRDTLRLILSGRLDPRPAAMFKLRSSMRHWGLKAAPLIRQFSPAWNIYGPSLTRMRTLAARGVTLVLGYGEHDSGWKELELMFGPEGRRMPGRADVTVDRIAGVDHNLSQDHAGGWLRGHILAALGIMPA